MDSTVGGTPAQTLRGGTARPLGDKILDTPQVQNAISNPRLGFADTYAFQQYADKQKMDAILAKQAQAASLTEGNIPAPDPNAVSKIPANPVPPVQPIKQG